MVVFFLHIVRIWFELQKKQFGLRIGQSNTTYNVLNDMLLIASSLPSTLYEASYCTRKHSRPWILTYIRDSKKLQFQYSNSIMTSRTLVSALLLISFIVSLQYIATSAGNFYKQVDVTWGDHRACILKGGQILTLSLDQASGSGFQSKSEYLFGRFDMQLKLVSGNSAGTVTAFYVSKAIFVN